MLGVVVHGVQQVPGKLSWEGAVGKVPASVLVKYISAGGRGQRQGGRVAELRVAVGVRQLMALMKAVSVHAV